MNRGNARANAFAVERLELEPSDKVLEVGFGGGLNLGPLLARSNSVVGVDRSADAVRAANRRFAKPRLEGRASFLVGDIEALPCPDSSFSKAITVHTVYFWKSLDRGFRELYRCLSPGGRLVLGFVPKEQMDRMGMPAALFTSREPDALSFAARQAGFRVELNQPSSPDPWVALVGIK